MKDKWLFWIEDFSREYNGKHPARPYWFKTFKVYWAYRWWNAKQIDYHCSITPVKTQTGYEIQNTNYASKYE